MFIINIFSITFLVIIITSTSAYTILNKIKNQKHFIHMMNNNHEFIPKSNIVYKLNTINNTKKILKLIPSILLTSTIVSTISSPIKANAVSNANEEQFINSLATLIEAKRIMEPTKNYVFLQKYDNARSNIQYIINQLQLQKKLTLLIRNSIDFNDDVDVIDAAQEAANRLTNTAIQYDSTVYTCVFIPTDSDDLNPSVEKYRKQANDFYNSFMTDLDIILKVASEKQLQDAQIIAENSLKSVPNVLFKTF